MQNLVEREVHFLCVVLIQQDYLRPLKFERLQEINEVITRSAAVSPTWSNSSPVTWSPLQTPQVGTGQPGVDDISSPKENKTAEFP